MQGYIRFIGLVSLLATGHAAFAQAQFPCGPDTVRYGLEKAPGTLPGTLLATTTFNSAAQYFDCPGQITLQGFRFAAYSPANVNPTNIPVPVLCQVYIAGPDSLPTGTPLASVTVNVDTVWANGNLAALYNNANFTTPVILNQAYVLVVANTVATQLTIFSNNYGTQDGGSEWLASIRSSSNMWFRGYEVGYDFALPADSLMNLDWLIEPFVSYGITQSASLANPTVCSESPVSLNVTYSAFSTNRMYNIAEFLDTLTFGARVSWGNGANNWPVDVPYSYPAGGTFNIIYTDTLYGHRVRCPVSDTVVITVLQAPNPGLNPSGAVGMCLGSSVTLSAAAGFPSYAWTGGSTSQSIVVATPGTYLVSVNDGICTGRDTAVVSIVNPATAAISGTLNYCQGGSTTLSATPGFATYHWSNGATGQSIQASLPGSYYVVVAAASGCSDTTAPVAVVERPTPDASITGSNFLCQGSSTLLATVSGAAIYQWNTGGTTDVITVDTAGTYSVIVWEANGCSDTSAAFVVTEVPAPAAPVISVNGATLTSSVPAPLLAWYLDGAALGLGTTSITGTASGNYTVVYTDTATGCSSAPSAPASLTVGLSDAPALPGLLLWPNPSRGGIQVSAAASGPATLQLFSLQGQLLHTAPLQLGDAQPATILLPLLPAGTYLVRIRALAGQQASQRLVIE